MKYIRIQGLHGEGIRIDKAIEPARQTILAKRCRRRLTLSIETGVYVLLRCTTGTLLQERSRIWHKNGVNRRDPTTYAHTPNSAPERSETG